MFKGKTDSGFEYEVNEKKLNDMRFVELLRKSDENPLYSVDLFSYLLGEEGKEALYKHLEDEDGIVPPDAAEKEFVQIMEAAGEKYNEVKNS